MHTLSGRRFEIGTKYAPKIEDIAISLARIPRWGGATILGKGWTVLHHSAAAGLLVADESPETQLHAFLHDMEEMATGDIPKPFKTKQQSELAERLQRWLYKETIHMPFPSEVIRDTVHIVDEQLKFAELVNFCHPNSWWDPYFRDMFRAFATSETPHPEYMDAIDVAWELAYTDENLLVTRFTESVQALLETSQLRSLRDRA